MKVRHLCAALLIAVGLDQQAYAEDPQQSDAPQAAAAQDSKAAAASSKDKSSRRSRKHSRHAEAAPADTVVAAAATDATPATAEATPAATQIVAQAATPPAAPAKVEATPAATESAPAKPEAAAPKTEVPAVREDSTPLKAETAASVPSAKEAGWLDSFLFEVKITDVLIAVFAGLLVLLGWEQARRMRDAVRVASDSASVAEKSARVAEDALISGQRAFMFIREIKTYLHHDPQTNHYQWTIHPVWANSGNTPTKGLSINTTYRLLDEPLPKDFDFPHAREDLIPTIAGPKSMVEAVPGTLSKEDLEAVQKGTKFFYIWGWAEYHDIFEGTKKHITRFCNQLTQIEGDANSPYDEHNPVQMLFGFHTENNYAD
ncbi:hypothetical protein [Herbaspirillum sp. ST 5-3]|uniref:hypothetical protein n=1 Tax=Oxalobacteraceae TaxID=75682 RepID=UPI0010A5085D|nr:hypothetical protein [Herbaspirillum sp. ST 5-3]